MMKSRGTAGSSPRSTRLSIAPGAPRKAARQRVHRFPRKRRSRSEGLTNTCGPGALGRGGQRAESPPQRRYPYEGLWPGSGSFAAQDSATEHRDRSDGPSSWVRNGTFDNFGPLANAMEADYQRTERTAESARRVASVSPS